jgi:hypothetical protein
MIHRLFLMNTEKVSGESIMQAVSWFKNTRNVIYHEARTATLTTHIYKNISPLLKEILLQFFYKLCMIQILFHSLDLQPL